MAATVESEVDWGICIRLATKRLSDAVVRIMTKALVPINSEGTIPLLKVRETSFPKKTAPKRIKKMYTICAFRLVIDRLPYAVANEAAKLDAPILSAKKHDRSAMKIFSIPILRVDLDCKHRYVFEASLKLADILKGDAFHKLSQYLIRLPPKRTYDIGFMPGIQTNLI